MYEIYDRDIKRLFLELRAMLSQKCKIQYVNVNVFFKSIRSAAAVEE